MLLVFLKKQSTLETKLLGFFKYLDIFLGVVGRVSGHTNDLNT